MPQTLPGGSPPVGVVEVGPIDLGSGVRTKSQFISDSLNGDVFTFHYKTNVTRLTQGQLKIIENSVIPLLGPAGAVAEFYGLADRTGDDATNLKVSADRLLNFRTDAGMLGAPPSIIFGSVRKSFGERYLADVNRRKPGSRPDSVSFFAGRVVVVYVWPNKSSSTRIFKDDDFLKFAHSTPQP